MPILQILSFQSGSPRVFVGRNKEVIQEDDLKDLEFKSESESESGSEREENIISGKRISKKIKPLIEVFRWEN
jgi:hypothetical protein